MAAKNASHGQPGAAQRAVSLHRLEGILRAGRHEAAGIRQHRRDPPLVTPQCEFHRRLHLRSAFVAGFSGGASRARSTAKTKPRATSLATSAKGSASTDLRGWNTTSTGASTAGHEVRTASRMRRLIRLRSTDPPSTLPTVNPTRSELTLTAPSVSEVRRRKNTVILPVNCRRPPDRRAESRHVATGASISETHCWRRSQSAHRSREHDQAITRGSPASRQCACVPWRDGGK